MQILIINNQSFDMDVINYDIPFNNTEIWSITNMSPIGHPFHIHDVQFYVLDRNGTTPPLNERGRKDVVFVNSMETVRFITMFETFVNDPVPYMYHCHMLTHEDEGMMGQFKVFDPNVGIGHESTGIPSSVSIESIYPNPFNPTTTIKYSIIETGFINLSVFDGSGRYIATLINRKHEPGVYFVQWNGNDVNGINMPAGTYISQISVGIEKKSSKLTLLK